MRRFRFRLAPILRLRAQFERSARKDLAAAMADVGVCDRKLAAAEQGVRDCAEQGVRSDPVGLLARALESGLRRHRWRVAQEKKAAEQRLTVARTEYAQKARELKTLQRLREQEHDTWRQDVLRAEQAEIDELAQLARQARAADDGKGDAAWSA